MTINKIKELGLMDCYRKLSPTVLNCLQNENEEVISKIKELSKKSEYISSTDLLLIKSNI